MTSYCEYLRLHPEDTLNKIYHDTHYGFPLTDDAALFERLMLEINQAGLSWTLILRRAPEFHRAYDGFDVDAVAAYGEADRARLLADAGIIRNRRKIEAAIENARRLQQLRGRPPFGRRGNRRPSGFGGKRLQANRSSRHTSASLW